MGWGVTLGDGVPGHPSMAREAVDADSINLAFRLAGLAARDGEPPVLVEAKAATAAPDAADYGDLREKADPRPCRARPRAGGRERGRQGGAPVTDSRGGERRPGRARCDIRTSRAPTEHELRAVAQGPKVVGPILLP